MPKSLPSQPSLEHLKAQAQDLLAELRAKNPEALSVVQSYFPDATDLKLSQAQLMPWPVSTAFRAGRSSKSTWSRAPLPTRRRSPRP